MDNRSRAAMFRSPLLASGGRHRDTAQQRRVDDSADAVASGFLDDEPTQDTAGLAEPSHGARQHEPISISFQELSQLTTALLACFFVKGDPHEKGCCCMCVRRFRCLGRLCRHDNDIGAGRELDGYQLLQATVYDPKDTKIGDIEDV